MFRRKLFLVALLLLETSGLLDLAADYYGVECFWSRNRSKLWCSEQENADKGDGPQWATFLGIGGSKTGSTSLFHMLKQHSNLTIAHASLGGSHCCGAELYFFHHMWEDKFLTKGIKKFASFFPPPNHTTIASGEKTPVYTYDTLAPYRVAALLKRPIKLLYTVRDYVEADMSLYLERGIQVKYKANYMEWVVPRIEAFQDFNDCRELHFQEILLPNYAGEKTYATLRDLSNPRVFNWRTAHSIESYLFEKCGTGMYRKIRHYDMYDFLQEHLHAVNYRRWAHVFGEDNILCIRNDDQLYSPEQVQRKVAAFLGLDEKGWDGFVPEKHTPKANATKYQDTFDRLLMSQRRVNCDATCLEETLQMLQAAVGKYITPEDDNYIARVCQRV